MVHRVSGQRRQKTCKDAKAHRDLRQESPKPATGTTKHWDPELKGLVLFAGKRTKTWYFQKDVGGHTKRILIGRYPTISADAARKTALGLS